MNKSEEINPYIDKIYDDKNTEFTAKVLNLYSIFWGLGIIRNRLTLDPWDIKLSLWQYTHKIKDRYKIDDL